MTTSSEESPPVETKADGTDTGPDAGGGVAALSPTRWAALLVLLVAAFVDLLDNSIANVAAPSMQRDLGAGYAAVQWVLVGYQIAFGLLLITGGRLGDIFGRKKMFLIGVGGFTLMSLTAGLSVEVWQLVLSRGLQGAFAGIMVPQVLSIIHVTFSGEERGKAFALHGLVGGLAATIGLAAGGLLVEWNLFGLDWRLVFLVNVPVGLFGLIYGSKVIPESKSPDAKRLDVLGVVLLTLGLILVIYPLVQGVGLGWPVWVFVAMFLAVPVLIAFVATQRSKIRRQREPLVELGLFRTRSYSTGLALTLLFYVAMGMLLIGWTLYMQVGQGWSALQAGLTTLPFAIGAFMTATTSVMVLVPKFGRTPMMIGIVVLAAGLLSYVWVAEEYGSQVTSWHLTIPLLIIGLGFGAVASPLPLIVTSEVPPEHAGSASGLVNTGVQVGFAVGGALISVVFLAGLSSNTAAAVEAIAPNLRAELVKSGAVGSENADAVIAAFRECAVDASTQKDITMTPQSCAAPELSGPAADIVGRYVDEVKGASFASSFQAVLWTFVGMAAVMLALMFALPRRIHNPEHDAGQEAVGSS